MCSSLNPYPPLSTHPFHVSSTGLLNIGQWRLRIFSDQRLPTDFPADSWAVFYVQGRIRIVVADPALNESFGDMGYVNQRAFGEVVAAARSFVSLDDVLNEANSKVFSKELAWKGGAMICVAICDLDPFAPRLLQAVRVGDTQVLSYRNDDSFRGLLGDFLTPAARERWQKEYVARDMVPWSMDHWLLHAEILQLDSYVSTPVGLCETLQIEKMGPVRTHRVVVSTDGDVLSHKDIVEQHDDDILFTHLSKSCGTVSDSLDHVSSHGDRAVVDALWIQ